MKKITLLLFLATSFTFAQRIVEIVTINGESLNDFITNTSNTLNIGTEYDFVIDFSGQETSDNDLIIKVLTAGFGDTANIASVPITTASGQLTVTLIPSAEVSGGIIQVRTTTSENFANSGDNVFDYGWNVDPALSTEDFNKNKLQAFYSTSRDAIVVKDRIDGGYSIYNLLGQSVLEGDIANAEEINVGNLKSGLYILSTKQGTLKFIK